MLIGYTPLDWIAAPEVSITGGVWLTADGGSACADGDPSRVARYQASGTASITLAMPGNSRIGVAAILGLRGSEVGASVSVVTGGVTTPGHVQQFADGSRGCIFIISAAAVAATALFTLPAGTVDVGELVALPAVTIDHEPDWTIAHIDPSQSARRRGGGLGTDRRRGYRQLTAPLRADTVAAVRHGGLAGGMDWDRLSAALSGNRPALAIPRQDTADAIQRTAIYGSARLGEITHLRGHWYASSITVEEAPATR